MADKGLRKNEGKPHVELCPGIVNELIGTVLWESAAPRGKYPMHNWRQGLKWNEEVLASLERHLNALKEGNDIDPESGLPHIAHLLTNAMFYAFYERHGLGEDDRPNGGQECGLDCKHWGPQCSDRRGGEKACEHFKPRGTSLVEAIGGKNCGEGNKPDCRKCRHYAGGAGVTEKCNPAHGTCWEPEV